MELNKIKISVKNINYCGTVANISNIVPLPNCDNVVAAIVAGNQVIVQKDAKIGDIGVFFPVECRLSQRFLSNNNLYQDSTLNVDKTRKGYVSDKGRLKCVAFRGNKSEGLFLGINCLSSFVSEKEIENFKIGDEFDEINGERICEKYVAITQVKNSNGNDVSRTKKNEPRVSRLIDSQFKFHIDTSQLNKNVHRIDPNDIISVTDKFHGTSAIIGNVLTVRKMRWYEKLAKNIGLKVVSEEYGLIYSSRGVIKNKYFVTNPFYNHEESTDLWAIHSRKVKNIIPAGFTLYGEIVGWTAGCKNIQKGYHYGCETGSSKLFIYRITQVNSSGQFTELSWGQIKDFCKKFGLEHVPEFYYGKAKDLFPEIVVDENWHSNLLERLKVSFNLEKKCSLNKNEVPAEGIVVRVDNLFDCVSFKLKSFLFRQWESKEMDSGESDIETSESEGNQS